MIDLDLAPDPVVVKLRRHEAMAIIALIDALTTDKLAMTELLASLDLDSDVMGFAEIAAAKLLLHV